MAAEVHDVREGGEQAKAKVVRGGVVGDVDGSGIVDVGRGIVDGSGGSGEGTSGAVYGVVIVAVVKMASGWRVRVHKLHKPSVGVVGVSQNGQAKEITQV